MELELGKRVVSRDGRHVGQVDGLVLDYHAKNIDQIIVRSGVLLDHDRLISVDHIHEIAADGTILLALSSDELHRLPEFVDRDFVLATPDELGELLGVMQDAWVAMGKGVPPVYFGADSGAGASGRSEPASGVASIVTPEAEIESNLPVHDVMIDTGTEVISSDGKKLGHVDAVTYRSDGQITGFIVRSGMLLHHERTIPAAWIDVIGRDHVRLRVTADQVQQRERPG